MRGPMDKPRSLKNMKVREDRLEKRFESRVAKLNKFVEQVRQERGKGCQIPYFDPEDGGVEARCLFLLESPGRMAVVSGFISRDNDDPTAENFFRLSAEVKDLAREKTVLWNIVPWYISKNSKGEIPQEDIVEGTKDLKRLLRLKDLRRHLQIIVLVGGTAQRVEGFLRENFHSIEVVKMPHPSPRNRAPEKEKKIRDALNQVARILER